MSFTRRGAALPHLWQLIVHEKCQNWKSSVLTIFVQYYIRFQLQCEKISPQWKNPASRLEKKTDGDCLWNLRLAGTKATDPKRSKFKCKWLAIATFKKSTPLIICISGGVLNWWPQKRDTEHPYQWKKISKEVLRNKNPTSQKDWWVKCLNYEIKTFSN